MAWQGVVELGTARQSEAKEKGDTVRYKRKTHCQHERLRIGPVVLQCNQVTSRGRKLCDKHTRKEVVNADRNQIAECKENLSQV